MLATATGLLRHLSKRGFRVSLFCVLFVFSRRQCRERTRETREGMAPGPAFLANEFDVLFEVTDPASPSPVDRPKPHSFTPESCRRPYSSPAQTPQFKRPDPAQRRHPTSQSTKKTLAPVRELLGTILPSDGAHYWILLVTLLVCPALILYGHHLETRERRGKGGVAKPGSLRRTMRQAEAEMKAKKRD